MDMVSHIGQGSSTGISGREAAKHWAEWAQHQDKLGVLTSVSLLSPQARRISGNGMAIWFGRVFRL